MSNSCQKCYLCDSEEIVGTCAKCHRAYCMQDASKTDPANYCDDCLRDVVIEERIISRTDRDYDLWSEELTLTRSTSKLIQFRGIDWMFACEEICKLSTEQLKPRLEYHKAIVSLLQSELTARSVKKTHEVHNIDGHRATVSKSVRHKASGLNPDQKKMKTMFEQAIKMGLSMEQFFDLIKGQEKVQ